MACGVGDRNMLTLVTLAILVSVHAHTPATEQQFKDQYCTDPRTMRKHVAYTEWADAYSCTRHRCQPGGRNLAIYTVGCKRVEAPESAIECEEVVEDTNMQFPFCCTRLRCLVVVRGEVWTRVLGQPWETLPAAPWSHMYKMKKPPPGDTTFLPKKSESGPVYELSEADTNRDNKVLRSTKMSTTNTPPVNSNEAGLRPGPAPDIVIALSTNSDNTDIAKIKESLKPYKRGRTAASSPLFEEDIREHSEIEGPEMDASVTTEKPEVGSDEKFFGNMGATDKSALKTQHHQSWTDIPQNQWTEHESAVEAENPRDSSVDVAYQQQGVPEPKEPKSSKLQALVDAIGSRMRDIENVVQRMSDKVHHEKVNDPEEDKALISENEVVNDKLHKDNKDSKESTKIKKPSPDGEHYKRFSVRNRGSKYIHTTDMTTEQPLFVEDHNLNGYFSDASNTVRRSNGPREPAQTYMAMAPVDTRRTPHNAAETSDEVENRKRKKHLHKKKKSKHHKKHHGKDDKLKRFNKLSMEVDKNVVSIEDASNS